MSRELPKAAKMRQNGEIVLEVDISPDSQTESWQDIRECCTESGINNNEVVQTVQFLIDGGYGSSWVAGMQKKVNMTGRYVKDNQFCEWLNGVEDEIGTARVTNFRMTRFGKQITCPVTLENIVIGGGTAQDGAPIAFTIAFNGKPTVTPVTESSSSSSDPGTGSGSSDPSDP